MNKNLETMTATKTPTPRPTKTPTPVPSNTPTPGVSQDGGAATPGIAQEVGDLLLWGFNAQDTESWQGRVSYSEEHPAEGKGCLKIDATGSKGRNQDLAFVDPSRLGYYEELGKIHKISMDVFIPRDSIGANEKIGFDFVTSGPTNNWAVHKGVLTKDGTAHLEFAIGDQEMKDAWKFYIVIDSAEPLQGPVFIDNVVGSL